MNPKSQHTVPCGSVLEFNNHHNSFILYTFISDYQYKYIVNKLMSMHK